MSAGLVKAGRFVSVDSGRTEAVELAGTRVTWTSGRGDAAPVVRAVEFVAARTRVGRAAILAMVRSGSEVDTEVVLYAGDPCDEVSLAIEASAWFENEVSRFTADGSYEEETL